MLHKMLIFKCGIDFSSIRRATQFPTLFLEEDGIPSSKPYSEPHPPYPHRSVHKLAMASTQKTCDPNIFLLFYSILISEFIKISDKTSKNKILREIDSGKWNRFHLELIPKLGINSRNRFRNSMIFKNSASVGIDYSWNRVYPLPQGIGLGIELGA